VTAAISSIMDAHGWNPVTRPRVAEVKQEGLDDARSFSKDVTQVFFIMGAFAIVAGILLIINIFVMMAEERKSEMGISRAVGMSRGQLTQSFLFEGVIFSALSAALGSLVGLGLGSLVVYFFSVVFPISERALTVTFHFEISSLVLAFAVGLMVRQQAEHRPGDQGPARAGAAEDDPGRGFRRAPPGPRGRYGDLAALLPSSEHRLDPPSDPRSDDRLA
jgi:hypothetical protein